MLSLLNHAGSRLSKAEKIQRVSTNRETESILDDQQWLLNFYTFVKHIFTL